MSTTRKLANRRAARSESPWRIAMDGTIRFIRSPIFFAANKAGRTPSPLPLARPRPFSRTAAVRTISFVVIALLLLTLVGSGLATTCPVVSVAMRQSNPATTGDEGIILDDVKAEAPARCEVTLPIRLGEARVFDHAAPPSRMQADGNL